MVIIFLGVFHLKFSITELDYRDVFFWIMKDIFFFGTEKDLFILNTYCK